MTLLESTLLRPTETLDDRTVPGFGTTPRSWRQVCRRAELEQGWGEAALIGRHQIALVALGDEVFAVSHRDPHTGAPVMSRGIVGSRYVANEGHRPTIASPLLKQVYDLATGHCYSDPALSLDCFAVRIVDGMVEVEVPV